MSASDYYVRFDLPPGLTSDEPMPYGYRRWSGVAWCDPWIDRYNRLLDNAVTRHRQGLDATAYVDALYRTAQHFDVLARDTA